MSRHHRLAHKLQAEPRTVLHRIQIQRSQHRLFEDKDNTDSRLPHPLKLRMGTNGTDVQQRTERHLCQPHTARTGEAQRRPED